jgi:hypothetical protein
VPKREPRSRLFVGCSGANIRRIEEAEQSTRPETLKRIAEALGCDIGEIDPARAGLAEAKTEIEALRVQNAEQAALICDLRKQIDELQRAIGAMIPIGLQTQQLTKEQYLRANNDAYAPLVTKGENV